MRAKPQKSSHGKRDQRHEKYQHVKNKLRAFELAVNHEVRSLAWNSRILSARNSPRLAVKWDSSKRSTLCLIQKGENWDSIFSKVSIDSMSDSGVCSWKNNPEDAAAVGE